jgi:hypothetical protein
MMEYSEQLFNLRKYVRSIGGPESTLRMLEFLDENKDDMPSDYREMFDTVMDGMRELLSSTEQIFPQMTK